MKAYCCKYCNVKFVVMKTSTPKGMDSQNSFMPVEAESSDQYSESDVFDPKIHTSHLLKCEPRRKDWDETQKRFQRQEEMKFNA